MPPGRPDSLGSDLSAYLDGELPPERAAQIERDLAQSAEMRAELEQLRAMSAALAGLPRVKAPPELRQTLLRAELQAGPHAAGRIRVLRWCTRLTAAAALLGMAVLVGWQALNGGRSTREVACRVAGPANSVDSIAAAPPERDSAQKDGDFSFCLTSKGDTQDASERGTQDAYAPMHPLEPQTEAAGSFADASAGSPALAICFRPRTPDEFDRAYTALTEWQTTEVSGKCATELGNHRNESVRVAWDRSGERGAALAFERELRPAEVISVVSGLGNRIAAPVYLEGKSVDGSGVVWRAAGDSAVAAKTGVAGPVPAARPASPASLARSAAAHGAAPGRGESESAGAVGAMAAKSARRRDVASASAATSQSQPTSAPASAAAARDTVVMGALAAWLNSLGEADGGGQGPIRVWISLMPVPSGGERGTDNGQKAP